MRVENVSHGANRVSVSNVLTRREKSSLWLVTTVDLAAAVEEITEVWDAFVKRGWCEDSEN